MEIIEMQSYSRREKLGIAKEHLIKKQLKRHGIKSANLKFTDEGLFGIIDLYTREAGVRSLEREIAAICRKAAMRQEDTGEIKLVVTASNLRELLGRPKVHDETLLSSDIGIINGLAYTEYGGDVLKIEVSVLDGTGKIQITGNLGDVMKESAEIAVSYVRSVADKLDIPADFYTKKDIHIHVPEGAVPKDGPSAGIAMMTAITSALTGRIPKKDVAMTGELSLRGRALPIGGLREKTSAAYKAGIKNIIIPSQNMPDIEDIDKEVRDGLNFKFIDRADEALNEALFPTEKPIMQAIGIAPNIRQIPVDGTVRA
jgi:ATP-dependent Lon protease